MGLNRVAIRVVVLVMLLASTVNAELNWYQSPYSLNQGGLSGGGAVTSAHENTHGVNSKLRQRYGGNCFFLKREKAFVRFAATPRQVTLSQVANRCRYKGDIFNLYMRSQTRWWNDTPLYTFDEWTAYMNGSEQQLRGLHSRSNDCTFYYMMEMGYYSYEAVQCMPDNWSDKQNLQEFWQWMAQRSIHMTQELEQKGLCSEKTRRWRTVLQNLLK